LDDFAIFHPFFRYSPFFFIFFLFSLEDIFKAVKMNISGKFWAWVSIYLKVFKSFKKIGGGKLRYSPCNCKTVSSLLLISYFQLHPPTPKKIKRKRTILI